MCNKTSWKWLTCWSWRIESKKEKLDNPPEILMRRSRFYFTAIVILFSHISLLQGLDKNFKFATAIRGSLIVNNLFIHILETLTNTFHLITRNLWRRIKNVVLKLPQRKTTTSQSSVSAVLTNLELRPTLLQQFSKKIHIYSSSNQHTHKKIPPITQNDTRYNFLQCYQVTADFSNFGSLNRKMLTNNQQVTMIMPNSITKIIFLINLFTKDIKRQI